MESNGNLEGPVKTHRGVHGLLRQKLCIYPGGNCWELFNRLSPWLDLAFACPTKRNLNGAVRCSVWPSRKYYRTKLVLFALNSGRSQARFLSRNWKGEPKMTENDVNHGMNQLANPSIPT
eukprot:726239-Pelagomonas_calceolata.AAC.2